MRDRYGVNAKSRYSREPQQPIPSMMDISQKSSQHSSTEVKHKLYMRIVVRMTELFGGDSRSIKVIKETIDKKLDGVNHINSQVSNKFSNNYNFTLIIVY